MNIWKLGCNWGNGKQYFDNFIRKERIVFCWEHKFQVNDIVMICKGHTVVALTKIISRKLPITSCLEYKVECEKYGIDYIDKVYFCVVEWYDLLKEDFLRYNLQQGICMVHKQDLKKNVMQLFEKMRINAYDNHLKFSLKEIAIWQLSNQSHISLPSMQRRFVWKTKQIEDLWDSLLRGFPVGSFLLQKSDDKTYYLIDGQQRATAIALGFYNQFESYDNIKMWSINSLPSVWIDLKSNGGGSDHKYVIRVITQSHPWGYQRLNNGEKLIVSERKNALENFKKYPINSNKSYTQFDKCSIYPYDSYFPIPMSFLLDFRESYENWKTNLIKNCEVHIPEFINTKYALFNDKISYLNLLKNNTFTNELEEIYNNICKLNRIYLHCNLVNNEVLMEEENTENPTLFVRLNSSGTTLNGDELIYSIYKACFPKTKTLIESIGYNFIAPTQIISIASIIAYSEINDGQFKSKMNVREFQQKIKDEKFKSKLIELIGVDEESSPLAKTFRFAVELYNKMGNQFELDNQIPNSLIRSIYNKSPKLVLMLVYWRYKNSEANYDSIKIVAKLTILSWFCWDINRYVREHWQLIKNEEFWGYQGLNSKKTNDYIAKLISPKLLKEYLHRKNKKNRNFDNTIVEAKNIIDYYLEVYSQDLNEEQISLIWSNFIQRLCGCKSIILFAQREYINQKFKDYNQLDTLEDTNVPWDWDHIYPNSWVYNMKSFRFSEIDSWNNSIGNFRALALEENRSENNKISPQERLVSNDIRKKSFVLDDWEYWSQINDRICDEKIIPYYYKAVINRMLNIYDKWWQELKVDAII